MPFEKKESDILFTRTVKAGKRVYYIDVKQDRNSEYYISLTESKRIREGSDEAPPQFEKHKIFVYREDIGKIREAFEAASAYVAQESTAKQEQALADAPLNYDLPTPPPVPEQEHNEDDFRFEFWDSFTAFWKSRRTFWRYEMIVVLLRPILPYEVPKCTSTCDGELRHNNLI